MAGFDHSAHATQVAGIAAYLAGGRAVLWRGAEFPAVIESIPPRLAASAPAFDRRGSDDVQVVITIAQALFAAKQKPAPKVGDSFTDAAGRNYRIQRREGAPTDAELRFTCGSVLTLPA